MPIPQEITDILTEFGVPAGAIALAVGLVRGAGALERDASEDALKYASGLLIGGGAASFGKPGATLVPIIFDRIFGSKPLSYKFISRSFLATTLFWLMLLVIKHPNWEHVRQELLDNNLYYCIVIPVWYTLDWLSLIKARVLMRVMSQRYALLSSLVFFVMDVIASYALPLLSILGIIGGIYISNKYYFQSLLVDKEISSEISTNIYSYFKLQPIVTGYIFISGEKLMFSNVMIPSTLLTTIWTFLLLSSSIIVQLLIPIYYVRRFTAWWFRDVEKRPLTAIAKVAGTLIIVVAAVIKAVRWI